MRTHHPLQVHSAPVAVFRVLLGLCAAAHSMGAARREVQRWRETSLVVPPALVGWLPEELRLAPPAEELTGVLLLGALWLVALTLTTGTLLPISAPAFALLLAYICSVDAALVFSHGGYVLWVLVLAYALLGSGGAWLAVDSVHNTQYMKLCTSLSSCPVVCCMHIKMLCDDHRPFSCMH